MLDNQSRPVNLMGESLCKKRKKGESTESSSATTRDWTELPDDVTALILVLSDVGAFDILTKYQMVCKTWRRVCCNNPTLWRTINMQFWGFGNNNSKLDLVKMCRRAVDRSSGTLLDLTLCAGTDDFLKYIINSCSGIRRLTLANCVKITYEGLSEVASKLQLLEDLCISHATLSRKTKTVEAIGKSCPLLKSLRWEKKFEIDTKPLDDECAKAIAGTMHGLQHLQLCGFYLSNCAVEKILDYCPHLETLDLRNITIWKQDGRRDIFRGDLERKMTQQIKNARPPPAGLYRRYIE